MNMVWQFQMIPRKQKYTLYYTSVLGNSNLFNVHLCIKLETCRALLLSPSSLKFLILIKLGFILKGLGCCNSAKFLEDEDFFFAYYILRSTTVMKLCKG